MFVTFGWFDAGLMVAQSARQFTSTPSLTVTNSSAVGTDQPGI